MTNSIHKARMVCVARVFDAPPAFALPIFAVDGADEVHLQQDVADGTICGFISVDLTDVFVQSVNDGIERTVGDAPLFAFEDREGSVQIGKRDEMISTLSSLIADSRFQERPFTRATIANFCDDFSAAFAADIEAGKQLASAPRTQRYFRTNILARDCLNRALGTGKRTPPLPRFRLVEEEGMLIVDLLESGEQYVERHVQEREISEAFHICKAELARIFERSVIELEFKRPAVAELPLAAAVLSLWNRSFPDAFLQVRDALQHFICIEPAVSKLAYQMWKNSVWNPEGALDFWLAAEKHVLVLTAAVICGVPPSAKEFNGLAAVLSVLSGAAHLKLIERFAHSIWEQAGGQYGYALDHWLAAEKQVLAVSVAVVESSSDAKQAMRGLPTTLESLDPAKILDATRALAGAMWEQAGRQSGQALDFWVAAEKHVLTLTVAAIRQAPAGSESAEVVAKTFTIFSPIRFLETISNRAQRMWQDFGRQTSRTFDYWLDAEKQVLSGIANGEESIAKCIQ